MRLENAGFVMREADTAQKLEHLRSLPARKFVSRTKNGSRYFIYADPDYCRCVFVGDQRAMQTVRDMSLSAPAAPPPGAPAGDLAQQEMFQDVEGDTGLLIPDGDILDFHFR